MSGIASQAGTSETDFFHYAIETVGDDPVADLKGFIHHDHKAAEEIL